MTSEPPPPSTSTSILHLYQNNAIPAGSQLVRLDLSDNPMTTEVAAALATALATQPHLQFLNLNDTSLGDEGVAAIAQALIQNQAAPLEVRGNF